MNDFFRCDVLTFCSFILKFTIAAGFLPSYSVLIFSVSIYKVQVFDFHRTYFKAPFDLFVLRLLFDDIEIDGRDTHLKK